MVDQWLEAALIVKDMGGPEAIRRVIHRFYDKIYASSQLEPLFENLDQQRQEQRLEGFIVLLDTYPWQAAAQIRFLRDAHAHLPITDELASLRHELLRQAVVEEGHPPSVIEAWLRFNETWSKVVLRRGVG